MNQEVKGLLGTWNYNDEAMNYYEEEGFETFAVSYYGDHTIHVECKECVDFSLRFDIPGELMFNWSDVECQRNTYPVIGKWDLEEPYTVEALFFHNGYEWECHLRALDQNIALNVEFTIDFRAYEDMNAMYNISEQEHLANMGAVLPDDE